MVTQWKWTLVVALTLSLSACSGSKKGDDEEAGSDETIAQDAGTDAVPKEQLENLPDPDKVAKGEDSGLDSLPADDGKAKDKKEEASADESSPAAAASSSVAMTGETTDYSVQPGDTLMKIAFETYGDLYQWRKIYDMNREKIPDINRLTKGVVLKVEKASGLSIDRNGEKYLIKSGDTLASISDDVYGTHQKWKKLYENNRQMIKDPNKIYAGFYLYYQMSDQDQKDKEQFQQKKGPAPLAGSEAPAPRAVQPKPAKGVQANEGGLIDPMGGGQPAASGARAPSAAPAKSK